MGHFGIMLEGRSESKLRNLSFENIKIESIGGGKKKDPVPEKPEKYPNLIYLYDGNVSTWGMFMRHVDGISFQNVHLWTQKSDPRPDLYLHEVKNFSRGGYRPQVRPVDTDSQ